MASLLNTETTDPCAVEAHGMRILEVSRLGLFKALVPETTEWIRWGGSLTADEPVRPQRQTMAKLGRLLTRIARREFDLLVLPAVHPEHVNGQSGCKLAVKAMLRAAGNIKGAATLLDRVGLRSIPSIVVDIYDGRQLCATACHLFSHSSLYFKRELDLAAAQRHGLEQKVRPISLILPDERRRPTAQVKDVDLIFAGTINNQIRARAVEAAHRLRMRGIRVYIPDRPLPYPSFMEALARSWLVLSPEGEGWDCYRHYEACLAGSVPLINRPTYKRRLYLEDAKHCFYYDADQNELERRVTELLADKPMLQRVAEDGRRHVLANHTRAAVGRHILRELASAIPDHRVSKG